MLVHASLKINCSPSEQVVAVEYSMVFGSEPFVLTRLGLFVGIERSVNESFAANMRIFIWRVYRNTDLIKRTMKPAVNLESDLNDSLTIR